MLVRLHTLLFSTGRSPLTFQVSIRRALAVAEGGHAMLSNTDVFLQALRLEFPSASGDTRDVGVGPCSSLFAMPGQ